MDMERPEDLIPHRPPFLLIDAVTGGEDGPDGLPATLTARFAVRPEAPLFAQIFPGHYPGAPVTPGVILCEIVFQAGALLMAKRLRRAATQGAKPTGVPVITRIRDARFKRMVRPGETLEVSVAFDEQAGAAYYLDGKITVGGALALRVAFTCALVDAPAAEKTEGAQ